MAVYIVNMHDERCCSTCDFRQQQKHVPRHDAAHDEYVKKYDTRVPIRTLRDEIAMVEGSASSSKSRRCGECSEQAEGRAVDWDPCLCLS